MRRNLFPSPVGLPNRKGRIASNRPPVAVSMELGQLVDLRIGAEQITVTHCGHVIQTMPRLVGKKLAAINYRHIIDSLVRKPGAFANYRYREEMFPTSSFCMAWDSLRAGHTEKVADKMYVQILQLAAQAVFNFEAGRTRWSMPCDICWRPNTQSMSNVSAHWWPTRPAFPRRPTSKWKHQICANTILYSPRSTRSVRTMTRTTTKPATKKATRATRRTTPSPQQTTKVDPTSRLTDQLKELLKEQRLPTIRDQFQETAARSATENLSHLNYLSELGTLECEARIKRLITRSKLHPGKTWAFPMLHRTFSTWRLFHEPSGSSNPLRSAPPSSSSGCGCW
jgi:hypothetical protein